MQEGLVSSVLLLLSSCGSAGAAEKKIAGYALPTQHFDIAMLDLDQGALETTVSWNEGAEEDLKSALNVYEHGGHSKSYAHLKLKTPLKEDVTEGLEIYGHTVRGQHSASGSIYRHHFVGETQLDVLYADLGSCVVGGLPKNEHRMNNCFVEDGWIKVTEPNENNGTESYHYSYDSEKDNRNGRTLASLSVDADKRMRSSKNNEYYKVFQTFVSYYGTPTYGDEWIRAAAEGRETTFKRGNMDLSADASLATAGHAKQEAIKKGTVLLNVWMNIIREMEVALGECRVGDREASAWDKAVAFYVGSLEDPSHKKSTNGVMLYALADKWCGERHTCLKHGGSRVNQEIMDLFNSGRGLLVDGDCSKARGAMHRIEELMMVPLIQGILHTVYQQDVDGKFTNSVSRAEGASFAAAMLPLIHKCSSSDASVIYEELKLGYDKDYQPSWPRVRTALERNYACLGVTCDHIGGAWSWHDKDYFEGAEPCGGKKKKTTLTAFMSTFAILGALVMGVSICYRRRRRATKVEQVRSEHEGQFVNNNGGLVVETFEEEPRSLKIPPRSSFGSAIFGSGESNNEDTSNIIDDLGGESEFGDDNVL